METHPDIKSHPILFSGPMIRAVLEGRKTQTRRSVSRRLLGSWDLPRGPGDVAAGYPFIETADGEHISVVKLCPYGQPGDRLWVREKFAYCVGTTDITDEWYSVSIPASQYKRDCPWLNTYHITYAADDGPGDDPIHGRWRPSIHMPRWASRITLEITGVRVERLQDITYDDVEAEGAAIGEGYGWVRDWAELWDSINGPDSWDANPWVWVVEFKVLPQLDRI